MSMARSLPQNLYDKDFNVRPRLETRLGESKPS